MVKKDLLELARGFDLNGGKISRVDKKTYMAKDLNPAYHPPYKTGVDECTDCAPDCDDCCDVGASDCCH